MAIPNDTICAVATPPGGAIAVIRLSGPQAIAIVDSIFHAASGRPLEEAKANTLHYGTIAQTPSVEQPVKQKAQTATNETLDDVLVSVFRAPHSYTGEDSVEISCHGSRYIVRELLMMLQQHGARQAEPGEYTRRAYLNGKMDLSQAEAVAALIASTNHTSHDLAISQLKGHVRTALEDMRERLQRLTALLELELDFSDHEDLEFANRMELLDLAKDIDHRLQRLADTYRYGRAIKDGVPVAIVGAPNVGKSTLLNRLLGEDRAIVTEIPGTTRDAIEDTVDIGGITFRFIDTAGLRHTDDRVEQIGISRTHQAIARAAIVIWVIEQPPTKGEADNIARRANGKTLIIVHNKTDLNQDSFLDNEIAISAKHGDNLNKLKEALVAVAAIPQFHENAAVISSARQYHLLEEAHYALRRVTSGLAASATSTDLIAEDLHIVLDRLAEVTGVERVTPSSTLDLIFREFCIGK